MKNDFVVMVVVDKVTSSSMASLLDMCRFYMKTKMTTYWLVRLTNDRASLTSANNPSEVTFCKDIAHIS